MKFQQNYLFLFIFFFGGGGGGGEGGRVWVVRVDVKGEVKFL